MMTATAPAIPTPTPTPTPTTALSENNVPSLNTLSPRRWFGARWRKLPNFLKLRHSLFWAIVPAMFITSCLETLFLMGAATVNEDARLRTVLAPAALHAVTVRALGASLPLLTPAGSITSWCTDTVQVLAERMLYQELTDPAGSANANGFFQTRQLGRLAVVLQAADGSTCRYGLENHQLTPALHQALTLAGRQHGQSRGAEVVEVDDGWTSASTTALAGPGGATLTVGVHILSPWHKMLQPSLVYQSMLTFVLCLNALSALVLMVILIRRIKRADRAATAWTVGDLAVRINDTGKDELSVLTQKFDVMADAMAGVIEVKQALASAEERNRLARDLHDSAKQRAFALNLQLSAAQALLAPESQGARLVDSALTLTGQLQADLSNVIRRLTAATIAEAGLRRVLQESIASMLAGSGITWQLTLTAEDECALAAAPHVSQQLFLITMEAVANALKHAGCTRCAIVCETVGADYIWRVTDNGVGLSAATAAHAHAPAQGMGLENIKLRAASLPGGSVEIAAGDSGGTAIVVTFQLERTA